MRQQTHAFPHSFPFLKRSARLPRNFPYPHSFAAFTKRRGIPKKVLLFPNGEERYDALMKFEAFAAAHEEACEARLGKFLKLVSDFAAKGSTDEDSAAPKGEFVRIMTFHKSKGLEFSRLHRSAP